MKILYLAAYFSPENMAFSHLEHDMMEGFATAGHTVEVICPTPTRGISDKVRAQYRYRKEEEMYGGQVHVHRFWAPREGRNPVIRAIRYFWCNLRMYQIGKRFHDIDIIFANSTPPTQGLLGGALKKKISCSFVYNLQDIFPDSLINTGLSHKDSFLWRIGRIVENATYRSCDKIVVISEAFRHNLQEKGVSTEKIEVIYNWIDTEEVHPIRKEKNKLFEEFNLDQNAFLVIYAGNLGSSQDGQTILAAADRLREHAEIQFAIFADGSEYVVLKNLAAQQSMKNVRFFPLLPQQRVSEVYSAGNVALITCKSGVGKTGMPSKAWSIMSAGTPIIAAFDTDSELAQIIARAKCGRVVEAGRPEKLAAAILSAVQNAEELSMQGKNGSSYVVAHHGKKAATEAYQTVMESVCHTNR